MGRGQAQLAGGVRAKWMGELLSRVGADDVGEIASTLLDIVRGRAIPVLDRDTLAPVLDGSGDPLLIAPKVGDVLRAAEILLDRMFGRPAQTLSVIDSTDPPGATIESRTLAAEALELGSPEELQALRKLAQRVSRARAERDAQAASDVPLTPAAKAEIREVAGRTATPADLGVDS